MKRTRVLATAGAGGNLQPMVAATLSMAQRGYEVVVTGDGSAAGAVKGLCIELVKAAGSWR